MNSFSSSSTPKQKIENLMKYEQPAQRIIRMKNYFEVLCWASAFIFLFFIEPKNDLLSICIFKGLFQANCLGCGIGKSIHYAMHLELTQSLKCHLMGIPAIIIIIHYNTKQILEIVRSEKYFKNILQTKHKPIK